NYHTADYGEVAAIHTVSTEDDILLISSDGIVIRMHVDEIRQCRRPSKGVRVMRIAGDTRIMSLVRTEHEAEEETAAPIDEGDADAGEE
ncbi:MAG: DNA gyrase subunit A, partial [Clostridia bacterium]|nr:DNA gyrase subunit A [Clostridia bacterium]